MDNGKVVQQGTPLEMLTRPATPFVREFFGRSELGVRLLSLRRVGDYQRAGDAAAGEPLSENLTLRDALSAFVAQQRDVLPVVDAQGIACGSLHFRDLLSMEANREGHP